MSEEAVPPAGGQCDCDRVPDYLLYAFVASTIVLFILILCLAVAVAVLYRKGKPIAVSYTHLTLPTIYSV